MHTNCSVTISQTIPGAIVYPESLTGFINQTTDLIVSDSGQLFYHIYGEQFITQKILFALVVKRRCMFMVKSLEYSSMNPREIQLAEFL